MRTKILLVLAFVTVSLIAISCGTSKNTCPAYGEAAINDNIEVKG